MASPKAQAPAADPGPKTVKVGNVKIRVRPWQHPRRPPPLPPYWRFTYTDLHGRECDITRADRADAIQEANRIARVIHNGTVDLAELPPEKARMVRAFLDLNPTWADLERWGMERRKPDLTTAAVIEKFAAWRIKQNNGTETRWMQSQHTELRNMAAAIGPDTIFAHIRAADLSEWLDDLEIGPKRRKDFRAHCVQLWRWARKQELIHPAGEYTEPEKLPVPGVERKDHVRVLSVEELRFLFQHVSPAFLPWLALSAFSGLRSGEIHQARRPPLDWSMIKLDRKLIDLPASFSKTGRRKLLPISDTLAAWLKTCHRPADGTGPVIPEPANRNETLRLGELMDRHFQRQEGWPANCLRHSFGSYQVAKTRDIAAVSLEMDNSPKVIKDHYLEVKTEQEAAEYFNVLPGTIPVQKRKSLKTKA